MLSNEVCPIIESIKYCAFTFNVLYIEWRQSYGKNFTKPVCKEKKKHQRDGIRPKNGGYEGRITVKVNGKSKQISLFNKDKRILVQEMIKAKQESNDNEYVEKDKITLEEWLKNGFVSIKSRL